MLNDRGWDSRVYSFDNGKYFFKFPRSEKIQRRYKYEIAAIKSLADMHTRTVQPKILWEHPEDAYFGYEGVSGSPLSELIGSLDVTQKQAIGQALGDFLKQFHAVKLPGARTVSLGDESKQIQRWYEDYRPTIIQHFTDNEQKRLHKLVYEIWPAKLLELSSDPVLSHGDLHFENILYGQNGAVGIIDFGDVAYYDRSKDFLELDNDQLVFKPLLKVYGYDDPRLMEKIAVRQNMIQVINLGFHAGKGDSANTEITVNKIKRYLENR